MSRFTLTMMILVSLLVFSSCFSTKEEAEEVKHLRKKVEALQTDMSTFEEKIKSAQGDHGLQIKLTQENEMNKARLERLKEALKKAEQNQKDFD
jgi:hypothetical protein